MPFLGTKEISEKTFLLFWETSESKEELYTLLLDNFEITQEEEAQLNVFKSEQRKKEWLATRLLICNFFKRKAIIYYDDFGKPYIDNKKYSISISHSKGLVVVAISENKFIGVDVELMSNKIGRIALKFLHDKEIKRIDINNDVLKLYLHWCAKEALYKVYGKKKLNFITNLRIDPIDESKGYFTGNIIQEDEVKKYEMHYLNHNNYVVVWTSKRKE